MDIAQGGSFTRCDQLTAKVIGDGDHTGGQVLFVVLINIERGLAACYLFHAVTVAIINKGGPAGDRQRTIFNIPGDGLRASGGHIAVGIVGVTGCPDCGDGVFMSTIAVGITGTVHRGNIADSIVGITLGVSAGDTGQSINRIVGKVLGLTGNRINPLRQVTDGIPGILHVLNGCTAGLRLGLDLPELAVIGRGVVNAPIAVVGLEVIAEVDLGNAAQIVIGRTGDQISGNAAGNSIRQTAPVIGVGDGFPVG